MQACMDVVMPYVHERKQFGQPIGTFQLVQGKIADMYTTMNASRAYVYAVAKACDRGETTREDAAGASLYASDEAINHEPAFARLPPKRTCSGKAKSTRLTRRGRTDRADRYLRVALTDETAMSARPNASACGSAVIGR